MKPPKITQATVLKRTNYGEADRVVTLLTKDFGKITVIAKGSRKIKSRLAACIEPFCISEVSIHDSRGKLSILTGASLQKHFSSFINDIEKLNIAYDAIKQINKITEENSAHDPGYYNLVINLYDALESGMSADILRLWWLLKLTEQTGHKIQQSKTVKGETFKEDLNYRFDIENGGFIFDEHGNLSSYHVKFIKITQNNTPATICKIKNGSQIAADLYPAIKSFTELHI